MEILGKKIEAKFVHKSNVKNSDVDILMPAFKERTMSQLAARSFFHFEKNLKLRLFFIDPSGKQKPFDAGPYQEHTSFISIPNEHFSVSKKSGKMSHSNAYCLEVGRQFCTAPYVFVCHNDVLAYREDWLSYLVDKMSAYKLAAFLRDNVRIKAAHVSGFLYTRDYFDKAVFWPQDFPEQDVGDNFSYYLQRKNEPYFVCPCSHNNPKLLKKIHRRNPELKQITGDKCLDEKGNVIYIHTGRGTVKMLGHYKKANKTSYNKWNSFLQGIIK